MAITTEVPAPETESDALRDANRLYRASEQYEAAGDAPRRIEALRAYLVHVEQHRNALLPGAETLAPQLDEAAMSLYRVSQGDLAGRAIDLGLVFAPNAPRLLHHKALVLLAQNRNLEYVLPLLDRALQASPHEKAIWATRGDALRIANRPREAAAAYLEAQKLDPSSTQNLDRALKLVPNYPEALRMRVELAKSHGGEKQALDACEALLRSSPDDPDLLRSKAELLFALGEVVAARGASETLLAQLPNDPGTRALHARIMFRMEQPREAVQDVRAMIEGAVPPDVDLLVDLAERVGRLESEGGLALDLRKKIREIAPRNGGNLRELRTLAIALGRTEAAIAASEAMLELSPGNLDAQRTYAELLLANGRADEAFGQYRELAKAHPREVEELRKAMLAARAARQPAMVQEFARSILEVNPKDDGAREELARALQEQGDRKGALAEFGRLHSGTPTDVRYLLESRRLLEELNRPEELPGILDEIFRLDPTRLDVALERGNLYLARAYDDAEGSASRAHAARAALVSYERASMSADRHASALLGIARASRLLHLPERATHAYRDFLGTPGQRDRADVRKELGHTYRDIHRFRDAEAEYAKALQLGNEDPDLLWGMVESQTELRQFPPALRNVEILLHREPRNPLFLRQKGRLLLQMENRTEALPALKAAVEAAPGDARVLFDVGEALRAHGAYAEATPYLKTGLELDSKNRPGWLSLAGTLLDAGRPDEAIPIVDRLLHEDPNDLAAWRLRADIFRSLQRPADLAYSLRGVLLLDPQNGSALREKAGLHLAAGEKIEALGALQQAAAGDPAIARDGSLWLTIADLASELGRVDESNHAFDRVLQIEPGRAAEITTRRARLRLSAGRPDLALELLGPPVPAGAAPAAPEAELLRAEVLRQLERPAEAEQTYQSLLTRMPHEPSAVAGLARCLLDEGKPGPARELLRSELSQGPADPRRYLLLAEAEAALGDLPAAAEALRQGTQTLPQSPEIWERLAELEIRRESWPAAADALAHAMALAPQKVENLLRAGFVSQKLGHEHEALALFEHATEIASANKAAWTAKGQLLLEIDRPAEAAEAFSRALALDGDYDPAKEGRKASEQKTREAMIGRYGRDALLLEAKLGRPVTRNDLFVTLHLPYDLLEPVLTTLGRTPRIDLDRLEESEVQDLEAASNLLVTRALSQRPEGIERRGFTLADVAVLSPPETTLAELQRLFGYLRAVLELNLRPENLRLTPEVEELARRALALPESQRTLFQLCRTLNVGIYKARILKAVETAGSTGHAPLPSVDLSAYTPEFTAEGAGAPHSALPGPVAAASHSVAPYPPADSTEREPGPELVDSPEAVSPAPAPDSRSGEALRCLGCGGIASLVHSCGAPLCATCVHEFPSCPKCHQPVSSSTLRSLTAHPEAPAARRPAPAKPARRLRNILRRGKASKPAPPPEPEPEEEAPAEEDEPPAEELPEEPALPPPPPPRPREKRDDEPRL